ncbi:MAG: hypothetical protein KBD07_02405, partial [Candidatus Omnitrophica bacterium]|nr:hypothetical protein [Candidatus Omnitrophota bacterium]
MKIKNLTSLKALSLTLAVSVLWLDFAWALDPRQKLLDDAEQFMAMQSDAPRLQSAPPLNYTFEDQNASAVGAQAALQELGSTIPGQDEADLPSAEPAFTLKTITGDLLDMTGGEIGRITRADGTVLSGLRFDADGKIIDADLRLDDGTIQLARSGGVIASRLPDGTDVFYDSNGRVEKTASSDGKESFYDYEFAADGTVMRTTVTSEGGISVYDANGRVMQTSLSTGKKIIYDAGVLARVEENGFTYRYAVTRTGDRAVAAMESITAADGKIYEVDEDGKIASIRTVEGIILTGLRWENGAVADADIRLADGSVCEYRDLRLIQTAGADGSAVEYYQDGPYLGYAERTIAVDGTVTRHEYALDARGNVIAAPTGPAQVAAKAETVTLKSVPAISYSSNPSLRVNFELNSGEPDSTVTLSAYNSQTVNILLKLKSGSATYSYGKGRPAALPVSLSADKTYTAELRWESAGVGIYVYEAGAARPAAPLARIASKKWNPKFSAVSNDAEILSYLPSAGAYTRTFSAGGAADTTAGQISSRTAFSFVSASNTNKVVLTAAEPQAGLIKNTYTATWLGGRWTLKKTSYNSKTKKTTTTSYTLAQAIKPGVDHAAELVFENGKIALYSYPASGSRPAVPALSAAALSAAGWFGASAVNAVAKTAVVYPLNAAAMPVPSKLDDSAVRAVLGVLTASAAGRPEVLRAEYLDGALTRVMGQDGSETTFENGLLKSAGGAGFGFETSVHGNLLKMTVEASGLKTSYDAKGRLASVGTADQTVFYSEGRVTRIEKADGTRIEDIIFDAAAANADPGQGVVIREATVRLPDGTVRRYREGQIQEERKPDGTVTTFADGRPMETRMSDSRIYAYTPATASIEAASSAAVLPAAYEMILRQHRTSAGDVVELASADGIPVRVTRANGDVLTDMTFGQTGELQDYILSTRDSQGTAWNLTFVAGELIRAQSETGKTAFYEKNRLTRITEPGQPDISLSYGSDAAGNVYTTRVTKETDVRVYDAAGKLIRLEADGLSVDYDAQGIAAISNGVSTYLKPVFAADGSLVSGRIRSYNGTIYTIAGGRLTHVARPDGVEIGLDKEGYTTSFVDGNGQASFDYLRDTDGTVRDIKAVFPDGSEGEMTDLFEAGLNPGYWPVEGLEGWSALTKYSESQPSYARLASGGIESIYNNRPASDTVSRVHLSSASLRSPSDRLGAQFYFDGYKNVMVKQGGFIYVKFRVENAPALTSIRVRPGFGGSGVFDDMAREFSVDNGVVTAMIPITRTTGAPVNVIYIDFVPAQTSADAWTLAVENAGYFELAVTAGGIHEPSLFLADDSRTLIQTAMTASRVPAEDAWRSKTVQFNRIIGLADAPVRMTVDVNGEALESVTAEGIVMGYTDGRAGRVTSTDGAVTEYIYDADGKVASVTTIPPDGEPTTARYAYGKIREVVSADGAVVYRYSYEFEGDREFTVISDVRANEVKRYSEGRLLSSADAQGILTTYSYAATAGAGPNAEARIASSIVTWQGQVLGRYVYSYEGDQTHITDEAGLTKIYNSDGELIYLKTAEGFLYKKSDYTDGSGSVYEEESLYSSETAEGVTLYYKEDTVDKIVLKDGTVLNVGAQENAYRNVLLKEGLVDEVSHEDGSTVKYLRDEIGRLQYVDVTRAGRIYRYDTAGALVRITDPADRKTLDFGFRRDEQGRITGTRVMERVWSPVGALNLPVVLRAASYGYVDGWNSSITVDGVDYSDFNLNIYTANKEYRGRGWSIAHVDASGNVIDKAFFDVYPDTTGPAEAERMAAYLEAIPEGDAVIMAVADEGVKYLSQRIRDAIQSFGSVQINGLAYRDSFALIGQKGAAAGSAIETLVKAGNDAAFASNVATRIYYYDETGLPITYDEFAASPELSWSAYHSFESEPEIEVFAVNGNGAAGWRKNFNPADPDSGFIYLWDGMSINNEIVPTYESDAQNKAAYTALTPHVPISGRYVYYDPQYPTSNTYGFTLAMLSYLTSIGYEVVGAADLKNFLENHGSGTALVMLQSIMPDTVYDPLSPYSISQRNIPRDYMEKGGTIVWTHDMPFYYAGHQGGAVTTIGEKGIRRMLGVIPTTRLNRTHRIEALQTFDEETNGFSLLGAGVGHHSGAVRFDIPQGALSSRIEATDTELPTAAYDQTLSEHIPSYSHFEGVNRSVDVRVEEGSSLSVGFTGLDHAGGSPVALSVRFEESGQVNAYVQAPEGGVSVKALNYVYTAGGEYTVELREKGYWTDIYIYRMGDPRPVAFTGSVPHALWKNGTFFAEGHKGHSDVLATRMDASWWGYTRADGIVQPVHEIPVDQPALDESILSYDFNINYRNVSWSAVKSQLGGALKPDTSIVVTYDADGRLVSMARADKTVLVYEPGSDRLDAVYDLAGYLLTDYVYDEAGELIEVTNEGQRRALDEALYDARRQVSIQKVYALQDQAMEAGLITQSFLDQVNPQRAQLDAQRAQVQNSLSDLEGQKMKGSKAKKAKSEALDELRDALRQIDQARADFEENVADQLAQLSSALNGKKLGIEQDFAAVFNQLEAQFEISTEKISAEERRAVILDAYRTNLGRDPTEEETARSLELSPAALKAELVGSPEHASRLRKKSAILSLVFDRLDAYLNAADGSYRAALLAELGLAENEAVNLTAQEIARLKTYLNSQSLHFGESAIDPLVELLKSQGQSFDEEQKSLLASRLILIDILSGQIHPFLKEGQEMLLSLHALQKTSSLYGIASQGYKVSYEDLISLTQVNLSNRPILHVEGLHYIN